ncbi:MAG: response regulator transcription factor [Thermomicrobiales bacterium]
MAILDRGGFYLDALTTLLEAQPDLEITAAATIYGDFIEAARSADVVLVQFEHQAGVTRRVVSTIYRDAPETDIIVIGIEDDPTSILNYIEAGGIGYVCQDDPTEHLLNVLRTVANGESLASPRLVRAMYRRLAELGTIVSEIVPDGSVTSELTARQEEVGELLALGLSNEEIADRLGIALSTAKNHVHAVLSALGAENRQQAAVVYRHLRRDLPARSASDA